MSLHRKFTSAFNHVFVHVVMFVSLFVPHREREDPQERGVKLGLMGCRDPKVVQVPQDLMGQR